MKILFATTILCLYLAFPAFSRQDPKVKFGKLEIGDLEMKSYENDPSAAAAVLHDEGTSTFIYSQSTGFDVRFERLTRIKIFAKEGYEWANFEIPLYTTVGDKEAVQKMNGFTYNLVDGKIEKVKLEKSSIFYEEVDENWTTVKIAFPAVKVGSVIELQYSITSPYASQLRSWEFQSTIPVAWSEYTVEIPEYYNYLKFTQGYEPFVYVDEKVEDRTIAINYYERTGTGTYNPKTTAKTESVNLTNNVTKFAARNLPAFKTEDFVARPDDYFLKVDYQLASVKMPNEPMEDFLGSWSQVESRLLENERFGGYIKKRSLYKTLAEEILAKGTTEQEKAMIARDHLVQMLAWNGKNRMMATSNSKLMEDKSGSSADLNLLYVGLLREMGLNAYPVILSTRNNGKVHPVHPLIDKYNYVIAQVIFEGREVLVDLTDPLVPFGLLPERCLNEVGRRIDKVKPGWVKMETPIQSTQFYTAEMGVVGDNLEGTVQRKAEGYYAIASKKAIKESGQGDYKSSLAAKHGEWKVDDISLVESEDLAFKEEFKVSQVFDNSGSAHIYINAMPFLKIDENPFKQDERKYPIDFKFPSKSISMVKIIIPAEYVIEELPQPKSFALPARGGIFTYTVTSADNVINVYSRFDINKSLFLPDEYATVKAAYDQVIEAHSQQIVLKRR